MIKTITINTDTHCVVPKGMVYELPGLPMPISKGEFSKDLFDGFQMHQYAMRYLDEAIAAAPQPEPVDVDPMAMLPFAILDDELADLRRFTDCADDGEGYDVPKNRMKRLAEIGLLRHVSAGYYEHTVFGLSVLNGDFTTPQPDRTAELEKQLATQKEYYESVFADGDKQIAKHKAQSAELEAALKVARDALRYYGGDKYGTFANEAYAKINEVLNP